MHTPTSGDGENPTQRICLDFLTVSMSHARYSELHNRSVHSSNSKPLGSVTNFRTGSRLSVNAESLMILLMSRSNVGYNPLSRRTAAGWNGGMTLILSSFM